MYNIFDELVIRETSEMHDDDRKGSCADGSLYMRTGSGTMMRSKRWSFSGKG